MIQPQDNGPGIGRRNPPLAKQKEAEPGSPTARVDAKMTAVNLENYRFIRQFPATGGEADIWLVVRDCGYYIFKHYRLGIEPKPEVLEKVYELSHQYPNHLIRIFQYGYDVETERWYEIQEYARNGTLGDFIKANTISPAQFRTLVSDITHGLDALHQNNILHLDLKPSNILIRSVSPLNVILTDFGISTLLNADLSRQITATKGTPKYWAPEQLGNVVGKEADYWALGVICLEILHNHHPFEGMNHNIILSTLSTRGIVVPGDINPKTAVLLKGLLTRNPKKRWGCKEVTEWLAGRENIPVSYEGEQSAAPDTTIPYDFREDQFTTLKDLMFAFIQDTDSWNDAKRHIASGYLTKWLETIEKYGKIVEIEKYCELYPDEDEHLLYIAARFNPDIPFSLYGKSLDISHLVQYAGRYLQQTNDEPEQKIMGKIFSGDLSRIYRIYSDITHQKGDSSLIGRMFAWQSAHAGEEGEKDGFYEYIRILHQWEEIGPPEDWDAKAVLTLFDIRNLFFHKGYERESKQCEEDLERAARLALQSDVIEPDLLVAIASVSEEFGQTRYLLPCLRKASRFDIRVVSLVYNKRAGMQRFTLYKRLRIEYETHLYSLSSDPWKEPIRFWRDLFFVLLTGGNFPSALSVSERILEMNRTTAEGWVMRGVALARMGRSNEAGYFLSGKAVQSSENPLVWQILGEYYAGIMQIGEAEQCYRKGLMYDPFHIGCIKGLLSVFTVQKRFHEIITFCDTLLAEDPTNQELLLRKGEAEFRLEMIPEATRTYEKYLSIAPADTRILIPLARCQIKLKKNSDAERLINTLIEQGEQNTQVFRLKAYLLLIAGKIEEAVSYLDKLLEREPENVWALRIKADAHISLKEYRLALICIDRILAIEPDNPVISEKKGKILQMFGFFSEAAVALKHAIDHKRTSAELYIHYGDALRAQIGSRYGWISGLDLQQQSSFRWRVSTLYLDIWEFPDLTREQIQMLGTAKDWYDRSAVLQAEGAPLWNRKGIIACLLRDFDQANRYFDQAINENYEHPAYITNLAVMYLMKGNESLATALFLKSMKKFSKNAYFLDQCAGFYYQRKGDRVTALELMEQAMKGNTLHDPRILYHTYILLISLGRNEEAVEISKEILMIDPVFRFSDG